ncbi:hypothetical protein [Streptomyces sp. cg40]|uniref:hypothetical protein n=1 Tax=Streptomyces sp. cg40 TaxID=3419764 RepID=UPI003D02540E
MAAIPLAVLALGDRLGRGVAGPITLGMLVLILQNLALIIAVLRYNRSAGEGEAVGRA